MPFQGVLSGAIMRSIHSDGPPQYIQGTAVMDSKFSGPMPPPPKGSLLVPEYTQGHQPAYLSQEFPPPSAIPPPPPVVTTIRSSQALPSAIHAPPPAVVSTTTRSSRVQQAGPAPVFIPPPIHIPPQTTITTSKPLSPAGVIHSSRII